MENTKKSPTYVYALGGLEEIGKNTYVVEHEDEIILIDAGIKFANASLPGFDGTVANFDYLIKNNHKIHSLVVTHGHEDHIGGIPHILRHVKIKTIYAPTLAAKLIERRLSEYKDIKPPRIIVFEDESMYKTKYFEVDFYRVCHSIPDSFGICVKTPNGYIVTTGDFRFDFATAGDETNLAKISQISNRGISVLMCESTSAEIPGFSESERYVIDNIRDYMVNIKGRTFISTFASNLGRVEEIIAIAVGLNKKICIIGKSMEANIKTSRKLGYLNVPESSFITHKELPFYKDHEIVVILTGSQGEKMAALNVMANNNHSKITLKPSDTIILSSNPIPGNYAQVEAMVNKLYKLGLTVYENSPNKKIHASGHATRSEHQLMIKAINPSYLFPIHGEYKMFRALKQNAVDQGFDKDHVIIAPNGQKLQLLDGVLSHTNIYVDAEPKFINGYEISSKISKLLSERVVLSSDGILNLVLNADFKKAKLNSAVSISTRGCFFAKESTNLSNKISNVAKSSLEEALAKKEFDEKKLKEIVSGNVKSIVWKWRKKNPIINVTIINNDLVEQFRKDNNYVEFIKQAEVEEIEQEVDIDDLISNGL